MKKLCIALAVAALAPVAMAQSAGDIVVRARAVYLDAANKDTVAITDVSINSKWLPEVDFTYYVTPNFAAELILTYPQKQDVSSTAHGGFIGTLKHLPPTLTAQYHVTGLGAIKPYVGAGVNYTRFSSVNLLNGALSVEKNSFGLAYQAGVDYAIDKQWSLNLDVKKVQIRTDLSLGATNLGTLKVDPTLIGIGLGYKF